MRVVLLALSLLCVRLASAPAQAEPAAALARMPIREVTVFKDGHAFVVHQGRLAVDARGHVVLDRLPPPCSAHSGPIPRTATSSSTR